MPQPDKGSSPPMKRKTLIGVIGAAAALIITPFVSGWESGGTPRLVAYQDIVKVWTICGGETLGVKPGMVETAAGCELREEAAIIRHADPMHTHTASATVDAVPAHDHTLTVDVTQPSLSLHYIMKI